MIPIAPQFRLSPPFAAQLLAVARRNLLAAQHGAMSATDPGEARRLTATAEHLRNRVSLLRAQRGAAQP